MTRTIDILDLTLGQRLTQGQDESRDLIALARQIVGLGVDGVDLGHISAASHSYDQAREVLPYLSALTLSVQAPCRRSEIALGAEMLRRHSGQKRLHIYADMSPQSPARQAGRALTHLLDDLYQGVTEARDQGVEVHFTARNALRTERGVLIEAFTVAVQGGASILSAADTSGYGTPDETLGLFRQLKAKVVRNRAITLGAQSHNMLGLAVANSLAAVQGGATQIATSWGPQPGRHSVCSLDDLMMALSVRHDALNIRTRLDRARVLAMPLASDCEDVALRPPQAWAVGE
ncbi:beta/alpha barrel domain-containing protein [Woodsholea maritima]|uniref:hypothetical protein n=1 Tax=Woodsholea maritima TaxID=240237 RepID=UPI00036141F6|nr:hypothetical protein [Woodsholea maritima]